jgi:hypothetical protein
MKIKSSIKRSVLGPIKEKFSPQCIRLAVVGNTSSGKSFLLKDIIDALRSMGCGFYTSESLESKDGFQYKPFSNYAPNQKGGNGGTPIYACRHEDHYGQLVKSSEIKFDLSFLNIPGEIFEDKKLHSYNELKKVLKTSKKLFTVHTYINPAGEERLIVKPNAKVCPIEDDETVTVPAGSNKDAFLMRFKPWGEINRELTLAHFSHDKEKDIKGEELMMNFFKYDTDSVMRSITSLIERKVFPNLTFDHVDFEEQQFDLSFVFFHYCTLATDIVLCDRVYTHLDKAAEKGKEVLGFNELATRLSQFLDDENIAEKVNAYIAFRNVDFLLQNRDVEQAYIDLNKQLRDLEMSPEMRRNVIYSLFSYLLFDHIGYSMRGIGDSMEHILGIEDGKHVALAPDEERPAVEDERDENAMTPINRTFIERLKERYIDVKGSENHVFNADNLEDHIRSRIGGQGQAFRMILAQTGWQPEGNDTFVPHVYFTCTPITEDYRVYKNGLKNNPDQDEFDFYREGSTTKFSDMGSRACFGSFQLCIDIFNNHGIGSFFYGAMLERVFDIG